MIQGIQNPIVQGSAIHSTNPLELKACDEIFPDFEIRKEIKNTSVLNGFNNYVNRWTHWQFRWLIHLYRCINEGADWGAPYTDPKIYFTELCNLLACDFRVKAHKYEYDYTNNKPSAAAVTNYIQSKALAFGTGSSTSVVILNDQELDSNDYLDGLYITWGSQRVQITNYVGSTRAATINPAFTPSAPLTSDEYTIDVFFHCTEFKQFYLEDVQRADVIEIVCESMRPIQVDQIAT